MPFSAKNLLRNAELLIKEVLNDREHHNNLSPQSVKELYAILVLLEGVER